jgi:hypothetical protein
VARARRKRILTWAPSSARAFAPAISAAIVLAACGASAPNTGAATGLPGPPCGNETATTVADTIGIVATRIYEEEAAGGHDKQQVEGDQPLLSALAAGNRSAVKSAVTRLVFSGTHIVRLRIVQDGEVLADVGGPYVLAPVRGVLRFEGRTVGEYVLSVQDDVGYVKLATRFIGLPLIFMRDGARVPLPGTIGSSPPIPEHGDVTFKGAEYRVFSVAAEAFPAGALRISMLIPVPPPSATRSCAAVKVLELGRLAKRIWRRFIKIGASASSYVRSTPGLTGAQISVGKGAYLLAGSLGAGPAHIPDEGTVEYEGITYGVTSFPGRVDSRHVRVYVLLAA